MKTAGYAWCAVILWALAVCTVTAAAAANSPNSSADTGEYHAILIGIDGYQSFNRLKTPVKDVEALADILKKQYGFTDVVLLTDNTQDKPTARNILKYIREKSQRLTDKDNLLVYYAGHGYLDELTSAGYWIPINGDSQDTASWISHEQIRALLETNRISVKNFLVVADSCYSGGMRSIVLYKDTRQPGVDEDVALQELLQKGTKKSREVITSGGLEPVEDVVPGSSHSLFAHYLLKALKENNNRYIDVQTLLQEKVIPEIKKWGKQTPEVARVRTAVDEKGLFILRKTGIADKPRRANLQDELERLKKENEALQRYQKENESLQAELATARDKQKKVEDELSQEGSRQRQLQDEKYRLDELDRKIRDDEQKLKDALDKKNRVPADKVAALENEQLRIARAKEQLAADRNNLSARERSAADAVSLLKQQKTELLAKTEEQRQMTEFLEKRKKELEEKEKRISGIIGESTMTGDVRDRFIVLDTVVFDKQSNLMWLVDANAAQTGKNYEEAEKIAGETSVAGYRDWRIPTTDEWRSLIPKDSKGIDKAFPEGHPFRNIVIVGNYWVAATITGSTGINLGNGSITRLNKKNPAYIWPVRSATPEEILKIRTGDQGGAQ